MNITRREENPINSYGPGRRRGDCGSQDPTSRCPVKIGEDPNAAVGAAFKRVGLFILSGVGIGIGVYLVKKIGMK